MEGLKFIGPLLVLALLVLAVALSQARFAGDSAANDTDISDGLSSTLGDVLGESESLEATENSETTGNSENEGDSSASVDVDSSFDFDFDFSSDVDINVDGEGSASVDNAASPSVDVNGLTFTCKPGEEYRNRNARCENEDGEVDFRVDVDEDDFPGSFDVKVKVNQ